MKKYFKINLVLCLISLSGCLESGITLEKSICKDTEYTSWVDDLTDGTYKTAAGAAALQIERSKTIGEYNVIYMEENFIARTCKVKGRFFLELPVKFSTAPVSIEGKISLYDISKSADGETFRIEDLHINFKELESTPFPYHRNKHMFKPTHSPLDGIDEYFFIVENFEGYGGKGYAIGHLSRLFLDNSPEDEDEQVFWLRKQ